MKFMALPNHQVAFQENVVDPILKALEKLVATLNEALEKVKSEDWRQRANSSVEKTNEFVAKTTQDVVKVAQDARQKLAAARNSIKDYQLEKMLKETQEGLQIAAEGVTVFAQDVATDLTVKLAAAREQAKDALSARRSHTRNTNSDGECTDSETEWEQVVEAIKPVPGKVESPKETKVDAAVVAPPPPPLPPQITKWPNQVKLILDIFPNANASDINKKLDENNGNVEIVLNALMERL
jgi:Tfp pilus assembly major pilin PilA